MADTPTVDFMRDRREYDQTHQYEKRAKRRAIRHLHAAVAKNQVDIVRQMLTPDLDVNFHYNAESALQIAVVSGLEEMCAILIQHGADVNKHNAEDNTLLHMAAWNGHANISKLLVMHDAEMDTTNNHGASPLSSAAYQGQVEVARVLVQADCDVNRANRHGETPLITSTRTNNVDVVRVLIDGKSDLDRQDHDRRTALYVAAKAGYSSIVEMLIQAKCDLNCPEKYRHTPLFAAAKGGHTVVVRHLVCAGADLNKTNTKGYTPFLEAVCLQHPDVVVLLAEAGCDVNIAETENKRAPIHAAVRIACQYFGTVDDRLSMVQLLVEKGCDLNAADRQGWTPLYQSAFGGDTEITQLLVDHSARTDVVTETGDTPLHAAVFGNKLAILQMLIKAGCSVNVANKRRELPLYTSITLGANIDMVRLLVEAGSELNLCEREQGQSPLYAALQQDFTQAVELLIRQGCDTTTTTTNGDSPLSVAADKGNEEMVALLLVQPGVDVDAGWRRFPLMAAAGHGADRIVEQLLHAGADVNKMTLGSVTALYEAVKEGHLATVRKLIAWGANPSAPHRRRGRCCMAYSDKHPHLELEPLYVAVHSDNLPALSLLLHATPRMPYATLGTLRDILFRTRYAAEARLQPALLVEFGELFERALDAPRSLQAECRGVIREALGSGPQRAVGRLPLPGRLQEYLLLRDVLGDE